MTAFDVWFYVMFAFVGGSLAGYLLALDHAREGKLRKEGITYSYFETDKHRARSRIHRAMYQTR